LGCVFFLVMFSQDRILEILPQGGQGGKKRGGFEGGGAGGRGGGRGGGGGGCGGVKGDG